MLKCTKNNDKYEENKNFLRTKCNLEERKNIMPTISKALKNETNNANNQTCWF
jgi:hypothetical protein